MSELQLADGDIMMLMRVPEILDGIIFVNGCSLTQTGAFMLKMCINTSSQFKAMDYYV